MNDWLFPYTGVMEISLLKTLVKNISSFLHLSPLDNGLCCEIVEKYYTTIEELLKLIKPILESIINTPVASDEQQLQNEFTDMSQSVDELKELFEDCHPLMSKVYFVCIQNPTLQGFNILKHNQSL